MKEIEFVKLKHWIDAEFSVLHCMLALLFGLQLDNTLAWWVIFVYIFATALYAAKRINFVEKKHKGYLKIPK